MYPNYKNNIRISDNISRPVDVCKKNKTPKISVIVPVYNSEKFLERCINSLLNQTLSDIEILLIDDGSTDNSGLLCDSFASKYEKVKSYHKHNGGLSSARNYGLLHAKSKLIAFVDSDDWIVPDMYEHMLNIQKKYDADIVSTKYVLTQEYPMNLRNNENLTVKKLERIEALKYFLKIGIKEKINDYSACTKLYKIELFNNIKFPNNQYYEDMITNFKLINESKTYVYSNKECYFYFQNNSSITRNFFSQKDFDLEKVGLQLLDVSHKIGDEELIDLSHTILAKNYMSMLYKVCKYNFADTINKSAFFLKYKRKLRSNFFRLLKSELSKSRKLLVVALCTSPRIIYSIFRVKEKI